MSIIFNSSKTADTINRAIDNSQGTTTTTQGATYDGLIISEDLTPVVQCVNGYDNSLVIKTISGAPPLSFHAVDGDIEWTINGNVSSGNYCGNKTDNLFEYYLTASISTNGTISLSTSQNLYCAPVIVGETYTLGDTIDVYGFYGSQPVLSSVSIDGTRHFRSQTQDGVITIPSDTTWIACRAAAGVNAMFNIGSTLLPYEPYNKYKIPVKCGGVTTTAYIDAPLRMSDGENPVFDIMSFDGTITRNCDTDGTPLETPTTETYTPITVQTSWGYNTFDVMTTVKPSSVTVTYTDN